MGIRFLRLTACAALAGLAIAGCSKRQPEAVDVVVIGASPVEAFDPFLGPLTAPQQLAMESLAQGLVRFDARGEIVPGLAERWSVSDDGLSYIFRLGSGKWTNGREIRARDVARLLKRQLRPTSRNELKDTLGAVEDVVAMTDRVIEIRLVAPRPHLLQLLAQPEFGILRDRQGSGPFTTDAEQPSRKWRAWTYRRSIVDGPDIVERVRVRSASAKQAVAMFGAEEAGLVLGGSFADLPIARQAKTGRNALRFDPVAGLFGLVPLRASGLLGSVEARRLLSRSIDRQALVDTLDVPGLNPRSTLLQGGGEGLAPLAQSPAPQPDPATLKAELAAEARSLFGDEVPTVRVRLPDGPGADILLQRLRIDWGNLGLKVERAQAGGGADFALVDSVAPTTSPAWFVRRFRCSVAPICLKEADTLMDSARLATVAAQRIAFLSEAARLLEEEVAFLPLAAPIRWSLVGNRLPGFTENIVGRHPLIGIGNAPSREGN
ncbi:ABC transporter substrate-binding protein [Sphingomonas sp. HDW15A]|uniref:ABC transporter substrate-binding protein n=1 Tax=Sphingomonas sp. HDW15A TaxID=2714942 RepID=UPI00140CED5A|nr:ABC transporter substrate-binding protein [Sphingomonas sp. HDW15A]QIK96415.1 ABC transporter substrate-binding protein [Sphingomonas sp. HDW15A]